MCKECLEPITIGTKPAGCTCGCDFRMTLSEDEGELGGKN